MAPSRAGRALQHFLILLVATLVLSSTVESKDYYSDPAGKLKGKFPAGVVQEAVEPRVKHGNPKSPNGVRGEAQPLEVHDMLSEEVETETGLAGTDGKPGGKAGRQLEKDVWSDPEGPLKGRFSNKTVRGAVHGKKSHKERAHKKRSHQREKSGGGKHEEPLEVVDSLPRNASDLAAGKIRNTAKRGVTEEGPVLGTRARAQAAADESGVGISKRLSNRTSGGRGSKNSTRVREQSLKWGRKGRPAVTSLVKGNRSDEFDRATAKLILASQKKPHKRPFVAQSETETQTQTQTQTQFQTRSQPHTTSHKRSKSTEHGRSLVERRELSEADNQKLNLIGVVTQTEAVRAVINATEGVPVFIPTAGNGVGLVAVKVSTTLLQTAGFTLQNVVIPRGVQVPGNVSTVILVFSQFAENPYGFTNQTVVSPVVGVTAYDAADPNAGAANSTLPLVATPASPFQFVFNTTNGGGLYCSSYNASAGLLLNTTTSTKVAAGGGAVTCTTTSLGTFTVISTAPALAPGPAPVPAPGPAPAPAVVAAPPANVTGPTTTANTNNGSNTNGTVAAPRDSGGSTISGGAIAGIVIGSVAGLAILALLALLLARRSEQSKIARMTQRSRNSEPLTTALIGGQQGFRAPVASHVRTRPGLEGEIYS